uniref:NADH-ubiquinone oxidoreductase chain 4 n=1 Tax=Aneurus sublobatus TaxID=1176473 RepID=A0A172DYT4_9HEMI|nr:NADH dehydrogenase subunit 4 [Aneurus sublobatus]AFI54688.1 NADH dehydrogenase subunit 4 [Aneurus sublobatus]
MMKLIFSYTFLIMAVFFGGWWLLFYSLILLSILFFCSYLNFNLTALYSFGFAMDLLSFCLILLTLWIVALMFIASFSVGQVDRIYFSFIVLSLGLFLLLSFSTCNLFLFYFLFECSIIPTLFLVFGWGYQLERFFAGLFLLFYTLFASLPMLLSISYIFSCYGTLFFYFISLDMSFYLIFSLVLAFLVKMPMVFLHSWLPSAHVEAPVSGSMILAGVLLKLGGYGLFRVFFFFDSLLPLLNSVIVSVSMFGMVLIGWLCLYQVDMKSLVAFSSVSHMALVIGGILTFGYFGFYGSLLMMIGHGLCSSGLFCLVNVAYERSHSRSFYLNRGLLVVMPSMCFFWFLFCSANMASPFTLNLMGEFMLISCLVSWSFSCLVFLGLASFLSCCCSIYLYSISQHGVFSYGVLNFSPGYLREYLLLMMHLFPLNFFFVKLDLITFWI